MIARWRCRLFGHRWEIERESAFGATLTLAFCRRCGRRGAILALRPSSCQRSAAEATFGAPDAVAACRTRAA